MTFASITFAKRSGAISTIGETSFIPEPTTRMSTWPNFAMAASKITVQSASVFGRRPTVSTSAP